MNQFRYGNWNDVSRFVDTKEPADCHDVVNNLFVNGRTGLLLTFDDVTVDVSSLSFELLLSVGSETNARNSISGLRYLLRFKRNR